MFGRATIRLGIGPHSSLFFLLFFRRLISAAADWMSAILPHMVWPLCEFKMQVLFPQVVQKHKLGEVGK